MDKPFKTFKEQIEILNGGNGGKLRVKTDDETIYYLMRYNYYSIINFYKEPFLRGKNSKGEDVYKSNVSFNHLKALHDFDKNLRILFFDVLTQLERAFKTAIAYYYSECYTNKESYLELNNYYVGVGNENIHLISHLVKKLNFLRNNKSNSIIKHYSTTKDNIPFWIVINFFTFGEMSRFYLILENRVQNKIISHFRNLYKNEYTNLPKLNNNFIKTFLRASSLFRNIAAHNERMYDFSSKNIVNINNIIGITNNKKQKLFTIYEGLKLFLSKEEYESLTEKLRELLSLLEFKLKDIIDINDILYKMDFSKDWHKSV